MKNNKKIFLKLKKKIIINNKNFSKKSIFLKILIMAWNLVKKN